MVMETQKRNYPTCDVLENLVRNNIPPALFIGAGISKRYLKDYPDWLGFVIKLGQSIGLSEFDVRSFFKQQLSADKTYSDALLTTTSMIESRLCDIIQSGNSNAIFTEDEQHEILQGNIDNIKFLAKRIFQQSVLDDDLPLHKQKELKLFAQLKNNIPYIFTTNYDNFIENIFKDYKCFVSQADYLYNDNSEYAEIYKLHGSYSIPNSMIFTERDYAKFEELSYLSVAKLVSVLAERPIIFLGYSINDPNILSILQKMTACLDPQHVKLLEKNLIVINWTSDVLNLQVNQQTINPNQNTALTFTYISTDNYCRVLYYLNQIQPAAKFSEVRKMRKLIKQLIDSNDKDLPVLVRNVLDKKFLIETNSETQIELAATLADSVPSNSPVTAIVTPNEGMKKVPADKLFVEALNQTALYPARDVITEWFMHSCPYNTIAPLYYYLNKLSKEERSNLPVEVKDKLKTYKERKGTQISTFLQPPANITETNWKNKMKKEEQPKKKLVILCYAYYTCAWIARENYRKILKEMYISDNRLIKTPEMKKAIVLLDYE